jgi:hypothetical protein
MNMDSEFGDPESVGDSEIESTRDSEADDPESSDERPGECAEFADDSDHSDCLAKELPGLTNQEDLPDEIGEPERKRIASLKRNAQLRRSLAVEYGEEGELICSTLPD